MLRIVLFSQIATLTARQRVDTIKTAGPIAAMGTGSNSVAPLRAI